MDEMEQAYRELERIQEIISRHEGHMFALRGWLLAIVGGLLAAYYTDNMDLSPELLKYALVGIAVLFLVVESRHVNLIEAVVERSGAIERAIEGSRVPGGPPVVGWYDGPKVNEACHTGATRLWPKPEMTLWLNLAFYGVVLLVILLTTVRLPSRHVTREPQTHAESAAQREAGPPVIRPLQAAAWPGRTPAAISRRTD